MGHRHQQHHGRSAGDEREIPGRDVRADDAEALESRAIEGGGATGDDATGEKPQVGKGGSSDAE